MIFYSFIWIYIFPIYLISPLISISLNSWFSIWISIELNIMTFIPLIIFINKYYKELVMKYFIVQSISSMMIILSSNLMNLINNLMYMEFLIFMLNISLFIKLGIPPFHYWFISLMNNMNWMNCFLLSTWQKFTPMILIMYNNLNWLIYLFIMISSLTSIFGINHQSIRMILAYSSINHMSWMLINLMNSQMLWILYFISYLIINFSIMMMLSNLNINYLNEISNMKNLNMKMFLIMNFLSISSLPPLFGFMFKWYSIYYNINNNMNLILMMIMMMSLITFFFYMKIIINLILLNKFLNKINILKKMFINYMNYLFMFSILFFINIWFMSIWLY
uniref:NADH-ubiquinone oxidoreductase chain 2 n=1 Tax=Venturia canescens TaxID=32260 RepID=C4NCH0_9HYME|nr:NADH dehydrogenase subunit 2 [Venturia canescens]